MASNFTPTSAELALVNQIFVQADTQKIGILTGDVAVKVFYGSKLSPAALGQIWGIADEENNGFLTKKGVAIALRLIGHAQNGEKVQKSLLSKPGPLATIEGVQAPLVPHGTGMSIPKSPPPTPGLPPLTAQDRAKFLRLFHTCGPVDGLLSGEKARDMFMKSKLSVEMLSQIWLLCDTQDRGALDSTDFAMAMYLIQASMSGKLSFIPKTLPPGLYEQASGGVVPQATGGSLPLGSPASGAFSSPLAKQSPVQPQFTGQTHNIPPTLPSRRVVSAAQPPAMPPFPSVAAQHAVQWDVTPTEKAASDRFFDTLDTHKRGYIDGAVAGPFMAQSKLSDDVLAQVWDLADLNNDGSLTRDGFAVAMHLIQGKLMGKEIPATLPQTLVPPSMRTTASPFKASAPPQPLETIHDLLWDDPAPSTSGGQPQNAPQPQSTTPQAPRHLPPSSVSSQDPFGVPSTVSPFNKDLLGDDDDSRAAPPLHDQSAEIGNVQNQLNSTNKSLQTAKVERENLETTLATQAAELSALQTQLAAAKASFETETALLNTLRERHAAQTAELQKLQEEIIRSESDLSAVRVERAELEGSFLRDKEEVRELNKGMAEVANQIAATKQEIERVKKDAKKQVGLAAIARKQFAAKESEKAKADKELEEAQADLANTVKEREELEAEIGKLTATTVPAIERTKSPTDSLTFAASQPLPLTPDMTGSMSPTSVKTNNPFDKLAKSNESSTPRSQSPFRSFSTASLTSGPSSLPNTFVTSDNNPFGLMQASDAKQPDAVSDAAAESVATPRTQGTPFDFNDTFSSPTSEEHFVTPNSGTPVNTVDSLARVSSLDDAASHFPALDDIRVPSSDKAREQETDLSTDLHDLDINESDSDDSDEGTDEAAQHDSGEATPSASTTKEATPATATVSFDDIFGGAGAGAESTPTPKPQVPSSSTLPTVDAFGAPLTKPAEAAQNSQSSFDEAFGKTPISGPSQASSGFSFTEFEDNFDFATASGIKTEPATESEQQSAEATVNGSVSGDKPPMAHTNGLADIVFQPTETSASTAPKEAAPQQTTASVSFDDAFSGPWTTSQVTQPEKTEANQSGLAAFEEAFGGVDPAQALKLDNSFSSRASVAFTSTTSPPASLSGKPFPSLSPPVSPRGASAPRVAPGRPTSPHARAASPPPRVASPKTQRSSTSSSRDTHEKPAVPPRQSKRSIRLPFGKKKKHEAAPPLPPSGLSRQTAIAGQNGPPGTEEDVEPVKQLSAMGFSRDQVVSALEANDYDVQRALNSLLGAQ
ncbi:hypothetical protein ID866_6692 [Astraeus odoratus]|nr:hypothetical protein ID866_6692 [Astraeus odoratus]